MQRLFDSLWRGYPVGSLLLWERPAEAGPIQVGEIRWQAEARQDALWVVDGMHRICALASVLAHPRPTASSADLFALWFDLENRRFVRPGTAEDVPHTWLPMNRVLDAVALGEWWNESHERAGRSDLYRVALYLGEWIRETQIPTYVVETYDPEVPRQIFARINTAGVAMQATEVFSALHSIDSKVGPLDVLRDVCREARMGALEDTWRHRCLQVVAGVRLDSPLYPEEYGYVHRDVVGPTALALGLALDFLRAEGHIPHLRALPYHLPVVVLTRFFHLHPDPAPATRQLLRRWLWRGIVSQTHKDTSASALRWLHGAIDADEARSVARMLARVGEDSSAGADSFAKRVADSRGAAHSAERQVYAALLAHLAPRHVETGEVLDLGQLFDEHGPNALQKVAPRRADRILHPYLEDPAAALDASSEEIRASHLWTSTRDGEQARQLALYGRFKDLLSSWCESGLPDLAPLPALFADLGEE